MPAPAQGQLKGSNSFMQLSCGPLLKEMAAWLIPHRHCTTRCAHIACLMTSLLLLQSCRCAPQPLITGLLPAHCVLPAQCAGWATQAQPSALEPAPAALRVSAVSWASRGGAGPARHQRHRTVIPCCRSWQMRACCLPALAREW